MSELIIYLICGLLLVLWMHSRDFHIDTKGFFLTIFLWPIGLFVLILDKFGVFDDEK